MPSRITIISEGLAFITGALSKNLQQAGFEVNVVAPKVKEVNEYRNQTDIFLVYAGEYVSKSRDLFVYLKDTCSEDEKIIGVIGYSPEISEVEAIVGSNYVALKVTRPFDMKELVSSMEKLCEAEEARKMGKNILLIDDDLAYLKMVQGWLTPQYRVTIAKSGMQAISYIVNHTPDLILLDYEMPITSGPQVMEMIRSEPNSEGIPIIFLTGKSDKESVMSVMALKPQGYMLKSMPKEEILKTVDNFFETRKWKNI